MDTKVVSEFIKTLQKTANGELLACDPENPKHFKLTETGAQLAEFSADKSSAKQVELFCALVQQ